MSEELLEEESGGGEGGGAPGWMVTFGDLMSLLLTFFILLLSMSTMDLVKFRQAVESFQSAFGVTDIENQQFEKPEKITEEEIKNEEQAMQKLGKVLAEAVKDSQLTKFIKMEVKDGEIVATGKITEKKKSQETNELIAKLNSVIKSEKMEEMVKVVLDPRGVAVRINDKSLFASGKAVIRKQSKRVLYKIGKLIDKHPGQILIEGHTDNIPIRTRYFPSNWELSSARASSVTRFVVKYCKVKENKIQVIGVSDTRPVVPNTSDANRALNRRVEFIFVK